MKSIDNSYNETGLFWAMRRCEFHLHHIENQRPTGAHLRPVGIDRHRA